MPPLITGGGRNGYRRKCDSRSCHITVTDGHDSAKAFIKSYAAVCIQGLVVVVMFYAFSQVADLLGGTDSMGITITALALALGVAKSGQWARQAVGA